MWSAVMATAIATENATFVLGFVV